MPVMDVGPCNAALAVATGFSLFAAYGLYSVHQWSKLVDTCVQYSIDDPLRPKECDKLVYNLDLRPTPTTKPTPTPTRFYAEERTDDVCYRDGPGDGHITISGIDPGPALPLDFDTSSANTSQEGTAPEFVNLATVVSRFLAFVFTMWSALTAASADSLRTIPLPSPRSMLFAMVPVFIVCIIRLVRRVSEMETMLVKERAVGNERGESIKHSLNLIFALRQEFDTAKEAIQDEFNGRIDLHLQRLEERRIATKEAMQEAIRAQIDYHIKRLEGDQAITNNYLTKRIDLVDKYLPACSDSRKYLTTLFEGLDASTQSQLSDFKESQEAHQADIGRKIDFLEKTYKALQAGHSDELGVITKTQEALQKTRVAHQVDIEQMDKTYRALLAASKEQIQFIQKTHEAHQADVERLSGLIQKLEENQASAQKAQADLSSAPEALQAVSAPASDSTLLKGLCDSFSPPAGSLGVEFKADLAKLGESPSPDKYLDLVLWYIAREYTPPTTDVCHRWQKKISESAVPAPANAAGLFTPPTFVREVKPAAESLRLLIKQITEDIAGQAGRLGIGIADCKNDIKALRTYTDGLKQQQQQPAAQHQPVAQQPPLPKQQPLPQPAVALQSYARPLGAPPQPFAQYLSKQQEQRQQQAFFFRAQAPPPPTFRVSTPPTAPLFSLPALAPPASAAGASTPAPAPAPATAPEAPAAAPAAASAPPAGPAVSAVPAGPAGPPAPNAPSATPQPEEQTAAKGSKGLANSRHAAGKGKKKN